MINLTIISSCTNLKFLINIKFCALCIGNRNFCRTKFFTSNSIFYQFLISCFYIISCSSPSCNHSLVTILKVLIFFFSLAFSVFQEWQNFHFYASIKKNLLDAKLGKSNKMVKITLWTSLIWFGEVWYNLDKFGSILIILVQFWQIWFNFDKFDAILTTNFIKVANIDSLWKVQKLMMIRIVLPFLKFEFWHFKMIYIK